MELSRRSLLGASAAGFVLAACSRTASAGDLNGILDRLSTDILRELPEYSTSLSISEEQAGGRYIDRLSDASRAGAERMLQISQNAVTQLEAISRDSLSAQDAVTHDVVLTALQDGIASSHYKTGGGAQAPYTVTQLTGAYTNIPDFLASQHPVTNREQADAYLARLTAYGRVLDQESERIGLDAGDGVIAPDFALDGALAQLGAFRGAAPAQTVLVSSFQQRLAGVADITDADKATLLAQAETIVRDTVLPAYQRQIDAITAIRPRATHDAGVWKLPDGEALYATALKAYTTTSMAPDEIHQMGLDLIAQFTAEMDTILRAQGMTRGSVAERIGALGRRPDQIYPSTDAGRERLLADLNAQVAAIRARMPEVCGVQARAPLEIKRVPEYTQAGAPGGYYQGAALDGSRPGAYYINLRDPATEWPKFTLPTLTYHEGVPGHHWQIAIQQESGSIPFIRSALLGFSAYAEGWGLYAEQLADEMGMYANDPFGKIGYLQSATFRASRLVCDTGLHSKRWTREQAIDSMVAATGDQRSNVTTEIERYCVWPGQACSYMVGRQALNRMREGARTTLGANFDLKGFHDAVLTNGSTPLSVTESLVSQWVATVSGPAQN
ncbi:DUF885 domain-containing protein [Candidatus Viadribacter manganicus]|uniref:Tat pathway signal protein n=1 Tax=Candidatus Viadribacter manganicus TaxID=1759059 RepID=A0A1B1AFQ7_9PROT|nr:DUF885 family protein [Candidatus Viadribacter manganicus]ANP45384.1 hypothetical protein ATE48_05370 [Candidatus Viadribacter manganicus]